MSRFDKLALALSLFAVALSLWVADRVFERMPHLEDEVAYVWQARLLAQGDLSTPTPEHPKSFLIPFVVDYNGQRFGKYPIGWPLVLAVGELSGTRDFINPLLAGLGVWLTYLLGKRIFNPPVGLLAAGLTVVSPFFLMNSGSLLSHPLGLVLSAGFAYLWLENFGSLKGGRRWLLTLSAALMLGWLVLSRPWTAAAVAIPFTIHGLIVFLRSDAKTRLHLLAFCAVVVAFGGLLLLWQYLLTGDPLLNPYTLWWGYDTVGFGPGHGRREAGHSLRQGWLNTLHSLKPGGPDIFGWPNYAFLIIPIGILASLKNWRALLVGSVFFSHVVFYMAYWIGSSLFGPRYYYEGLYSLTLLTSAGIFWLAFGKAGLSRDGPFLRENRREQPEEEAHTDSELLAGTPDGLPDGVPATDPLPRRRMPVLPIFRRVQPWVIALVLVLAVGYNLGVYLPDRLSRMVGLYDMRRSMMDPFIKPEAQEFTPALVIVHSERWMRYGVLLELQNPTLTSPFIFAWSRGRVADRALARDFADRTVIHYYVDNPGLFYFEPLE